MILLKNVNEQVYYYRINVYQTLFGDYLVQREYGLQQNLNPTNTIKEYVCSKKEALFKVLDIALAKKELGYCKMS